MTREEFIAILDEKRYSHEIERNKIVVIHEGDVYLNALTSLPPGVEFKNGGGVHLDGLTSLPPGLEFNNGGGVWLNELTSLPSDFEFRNIGDVYLYQVESIHSSVEFNNEGEVFLASLVGYFDYRKSNIEGINNKRLLNVMIKREMFI